MRFKSSQFRGSRLFSRHKKLKDWNVQSTTALSAFVVHAFNLEPGTHNNEPRVSGWKLLKKHQEEEV